MQKEAHICATKPLVHNQLSCYMCAKKKHARLKRWTGCTVSEHICATKHGSKPTFLCKCVQQNSPDWSPSVLVFWLLVAHIAGKDGFGSMFSWHKYGLLFAQTLHPVYLFLQKMCATVCVQPTHKLDETKKRLNLLSVQI